MTTASIPTRYAASSGLRSDDAKAGLPGTYRELLASCYRSCLELAAENSLENVAFCCISTGGFYPYDTLEEYWAFWSRYIWINRYAPAPKPVYDELLALVKEKDYFVLIAANP